MAVAALTRHGMSGYRTGCRCEPCRRAKRDYMREYRAAAKERARSAPVEAPPLIAEPTLPSDPEQAELVFDPDLEDGPIETALTADLGKLVVAVPWMGTLSALARTDARIVDQAGRHQNLSVLSGAQLRMFDILDRLRAVSAGGGVAAEAAAFLSGLNAPD
jgi:hypothetical protein